MSKAAKSVVRGSALSVSQNARGCAGCFAWLFAVMFLGVGSVFFYVLALRPMYGIWQAKNWVSTPCIVVSSDLKAEDESQLLNIVFKYTVDQKEYQSKTYCFVSIASNTANGWKWQVLKDHPAGKETTCFVNPQDPTEAVIERGWVPDLWWGLFPIPFMLVGGVALLVAMGVIRFSSSTSRPGSSNWKPTPQPRALPQTSEELDTASTVAPQPDGGPVTLKPASTPLGGCLVVLVVSLFWNGILSIFVWQAYQQFQKGQIAGWGWFQVVFLVPFVFVGLALIAGVLYAMLNLFNPRPTLIVNSQSVPLGGELQIGWTVSGRVAAITRFTITLKGIEKATYQRGTTTHTDEATFTEIQLVETFEMFEIAEGEAAMTIPTDTMHSFAAPRNKIEWSLIVNGDIQLWPDMSSTFPITVLPKRAKGAT